MLSSGVEKGPSRSLFPPSTVTCAIHLFDDLTRLTPKNPDVLVLGSLVRIILDLGDANVVLLVGIFPSLIKIKAS